MNKSRRENVLIISLDCVRPDSLGCCGSTEISTPSIDAIASTGHRFAEAISQAPYTPSSHASVFTGLNPNRHGIRSMIGQKMLPVPTVAEIFHSGGWSTGAFVGASALSREYGLDRGFNTYDEEFEEKQTNWVLGFRRDCKESTTKAIEWLQGREKFFLFLHYFDAHAYEGEMVTRSTQQRGLAAIDSQVGRLLEYLAESSRIDRTAVIVFADHGDSISEHGENGHLEHLYDATLKIPLIMKLPGYPEGGVIEQQVRAIDIAPTLLDYCGLFPLLPEGVSLDGKSLIPLIAGDGTSEPGAAFSETYMEAGQKKSKKTTTRYFSIRTRSRKLIYEKLSDTWHAFDLISDPGETRDIFGEDDLELPGLKASLVEYIHRGEKLESRRMQTEEEGEIRRSLEALGYVDGEARVPQDTMSFFSSLDEAKRLVNLGRHEEAVNKAKEVLLAKSVEEDLRWNGRMRLAEALRGLKKTDDAMEQLHVILNGTADAYLTARAAVLMATILGERQLASQGISVLDERLTSSEESDADVEIMLRTKRAALCRENRDYEKAMSDYEHILRLSPENIDACYNLGSLLKQLGDYAQAQACFQKVLRISTPFTNKYHGGAHYHLGDIALKRSLNGSAEHSLRQCLELDPSHGAAKRVLEKVSASESE